MKLRSAVRKVKSVLPISVLPLRIFVLSKFVTLLSAFIFSCRSPYPTSTHVRFRAPCCSKQSEKPPVDDPTSMQLLSWGERLNAFNAYSSLSPPLLTYFLGSLSMSMLSDWRTSWLLFKAKLPFTFTRFELISGIASTNSEIIFLRRSSVSSFTRAMGLCYPLLNVPCWLRTKEFMKIAITILFFCNINLLVEDFSIFWPLDLSENPHGSWLIGAAC